jgi:hypothetical protein
MEMKGSVEWNPDLVAYVIEEFPGLKRLSLDHNPHITVQDLVDIFDEFKGRHNKLGPFEYRYFGRMLAFFDPDYENCGTYNYDYWYLLHETIGLSLQFEQY